MLSGIPGDDLREGADAGTWVSTHALDPGTSYIVTSYSPHPTAAELQAVAAAAYPDAATMPYRTLEIPQANTGRTGRARSRSRAFTPPWPNRQTQQAQLAIIDASPYAPAYALARQLAQRAHTPYQFVVAVKRYLSRGFTYDENPPAAAYPLESFLFAHKLGYCQQFSGAMALLLRMGGVPARVAAGFTSGAFQNESHTWQVSDTDAHAWVEAWFPRYGWVRFDPTPATAPARGGTATEPILKSLSGLSGETPGGIAPWARRRDHGAATARRTTTPAPRVRARGWCSRSCSWPRCWAGWPGCCWRPPAPPRSCWPSCAGRWRAPDDRWRQDATLASLERRFADSPEAVGLRARAAAGALRRPGRSALRLSGARCAASWRSASERPGGCGRCGRCRRACGPAVRAPEH